MPVPDTNDPRRRFVLDDPTGIEIDGVPYAEWLRRHKRAAAKRPARPANAAPPPDDHPATASGADSEQVPDDCVFFSFDLE